MDWLNEILRTDSVTVVPVQNLFIEEEVFMRLVSRCYPRTKNMKNCSQTEGGRNPHTDHSEKHSLARSAGLAKV